MPPGNHGKFRTVLDFDISFLKIRQKLTELRQLEDKNAADHKTREIF